MIRMNKQEALDNARKNMGQFFTGSSGKSSVVKYSSEQMARLAVKNKLADGEIHPKRARIMLRLITLKYSPIA